MLRKLFCLAIILISFAMGGYYDSGMITITQPNNITFQARIFGDGAEAYITTSDGYEIVLGLNDYYYYAILDSSENIFIPTQYKVGIDSPYSLSYDLDYNIDSLYYSQSAAASPNGNYKIGIVLVEFSDVKHYEDSNGDGYTKSDFETMMFSDDGSWNTAETGATNPEGREVFGSLKEYYEFQTNGNVTIDATSCVILDPSGKLWHEVSHTKSNSSMSRIINELNLDSSPYNNYDKICIIYSGITEYPEHYRGTKINPQAQVNGRYWIVGERHNYGNYIMGFVNSGINAHEFGHTIGLRHTAGETWKTALMSNTTRYFDVMLNGNVNGPDKDGACPASINPVYKIWHGWIDEQDTIHITKNTSNLSIEYNYNTPKYYIVNRDHGTTGGEYFILENRQRDGWDEYTSIKPEYVAQPDDVNGNDGGLLILRVQEISSSVMWATSIPACDEYADDYTSTDYPRYQNANCRTPFPLFQNQSINDYSSPSTNFITRSGYTITGATNSNYAFHNIVWDDNSKIVTLDIITNFDNTWSGNLTTNTEWSGIVKIEDDVTVNSGVILTIASGTTVKTAPGKHLYVNGTLSANGVTFTGLSGTWSGIEYKSGSSGMIYNSTINNASYGIKITSANPLIQNNTITNCGDRGLSVYSASPRILSNNIIDSRVYLNNCDSEFSNNYITGETNVGYPPYCSVYLYNSQPFFMYNTIDIEDEFSIVTYNSSMEFGLSGESPPDCGGYNVLDNDPLNDGIIHATNYSDIYFGQGDDQDLFDYGYNTILGEDCPLWTDGTSYIDAQWCYWTDGDPAPSCYGNVETDYELDEDPDGGSSLAKSASSSETISENQITFEDSLFSDVFQMMRNKEFESALTTLENIIINYEDTRYAYRAVNLALKLKRNQEITDNGEWLDKISKLVRNDDLLGMIDLKKVSNYQNKGEIDKAIVLSEKIPDTRKNIEYEVASLFNLFNFYHKDKDNLEMAKLYLDELKENYPDNDLTYIARMDMGEEITYVKLEKESSSEAISEEMVIPENYALNAAYPNPFNPSTTIEFALPVQSDVECSIFDLRGNLVKEYSYNQNAGTHRIVWDALNVSSGIYLIRFVAEASDGSETFVDYQKVTLLK